LNGVIVVDKPQWHTSFDVIARLRGILGERRLGHGGTLDPMATGVLPVFAGTATKAADMVPRSDKRYRAEVQLGIATDTGDVTGETVAQDGVVCSREALEAAARGFAGKTGQRAPMYSAVKVGGQRLYRLARQGKTAERPVREIEIYGLEILDFDAQNGRFLMDVHCSKGTYIRVLAEDMARRAGCLAALCGLRRTESAGFGERDAHTIEEIEEAGGSGDVGGMVVPVERLFNCYRRVTLDDGLARRFLNGAWLSATAAGPEAGDGETVAVYGEGGLFLGVARGCGGELKKIKQFYIP
jgi:tRNA pseudouridine55 synthase